MFYTIFRTALLLSMLTPLTEALWALEISYTWSDSGYPRIILMESGKSTTENVLEIGMGEMKKFGPLERTDSYVMELYAGSEQHQIDFEFNQDWTISQSPETSAIKGVEFRHRVVCAENWYGADCDTFCETSVSHRCTKRGEKICFPGYEGEDCRPVGSSQTWSESEPKHMKPAGAGPDAHTTETATAEADTIQVNRSTYVLLLAMTCLLTVILVALFAFVILRKIPSGKEPLLPVHHDDGCESRLPTPPRLKMLKEMVQGKPKKQQSTAQIPKILSEVPRTEQIMNNNEETILDARRQSEASSYNSTPSLRTVGSNPSDRDIAAFSIVTLPEPMEPFDSKTYSSIGSPESQSSSRTIPEDQV